MVKVILLCTLILLLDCHVETKDDYSSTFLKLHGNNNSLNVNELDLFFTSLKYINNDFASKNMIKKKELNSSCPLCSAKCLSGKEIFEQYNFNPNESIGVNQFKQILPALLFRIQNTNCFFKDDKSTSHKKPNIAETWGYGFLFVTLINLCSLTGVFFIPAMKLKMFKYLLIFMVALAVGSLLGMALLFLIPETLQLADIVKESPQFDGYLFKTTVVACGIYMFFIFERALKYFVGLKIRDPTGHHGHSHMMPIHKNKNSTRIRFPSYNLDVQQDPLIDYVIPDQHLQLSTVTEKKCNSEMLSQLKVDSNGFSENKMTFKTESLVNMNGGNLFSKPNSLTSVKEEKSIVTPVAWMVITGDGIHNFIDGLSIGAVFASSTLSGIIISVTILCEELPHKLGDIALLLNAGMKIKQALCWSLLSSSSCYFGLVIGILLGELTNGAVWVFALAGGMFLYISLVDLLPEMNLAMEVEESLTLGRGKIFLLQNLGLVAGFSILLTLALYGDNITF